MMKKIDTENNSLVANYGHQFSNKISFESNIRVVETYNQYDAEDNTPVGKNSYRRSGCDYSHHQILL